MTVDPFALSELPRNYLEGRCNDDILLENPSVGAGIFDLFFVSLCFVDMILIPSSCD